MTAESKRNKSRFNDLAPRKSRKADDLHEVMLLHGIDFATGVPCGVLRQIISRLHEDGRVLHVPANREPEAVGIAVGAYLGGKRPVVYMQNSGFFAASNDIASLVMPFRIPLLFVVSYRGCEGEDAVQHLVTGNGTERLLKILGMEFAVLESGDIRSPVDRLMAAMDNSSKPVCLLLKRGWDR
jgi:sulfopyruvate decarboxylase alpha subunit